MVPKSINSKKDLRVLIVEDNNLTRVSLTDLCQLHGVVVVGAAKTASEGIQMAKAGNPDVALLDLDLGDGPTGIDLAWGLRKMIPRIGIVLLTSYQDPRLTGQKSLITPNHTKYIVKQDVTSSEILISALFNSLQFPTEKNKEEASSRLSLTDNEIALLRKVWEGKSNSEISKLQSITPKSVENAIRRLSKKIDIPYSSDSNQRILLVRFYQELIGKIS